MELGGATDEPGAPLLVPLPAPEDEPTAKRALGPAGRAGSLNMAEAKEAILEAQRTAAECGKASPIRAAVVGGGAPLAIHLDGTIELIHPSPQEGKPPIEKCIREGIDTHPEVLRQGLLLCGRLANAGVLLAPSHDP